jgi:uncharacterized protein YjbJ (UPF0337 family)
MSAEDNVKNTAETAKGKAKEGVGKATGNESLDAEGHADQAKGTSSRPVKKSRTSSRSS